MNTPFIQADETVIFVDAGCDENVAYNGPIATIKDVAKKLEGFEGVQKVVRINYNDRTVEDITEEVAEAYIRYFGDKIDEDSDVDEWLLNSRAYEDHIEALEAEALEDSIYGSYEDQNRLRLSDVL